MELGQCLVTDINTAFIKLTRISLTTEQKEYCSKLKSAPKYASDFKSEIEIVEEKIKSQFTDLKTAVIKLKRISLTTEQKEYLRKIKKCPPKYASDVQSEKRKNPYKIQFSKKTKKFEKENEEPKNFIQEQQPFTCVYCEKSFHQVHEVKNHIKFCVILKTILSNDKKDCIKKEGIDDSPTSPTNEITNAGLTEKMLYLYDTLLKQSEKDPERDIIGPFMIKPCKETYPDYYSVIKNPMDMETIKKRIKSNSYQTLKKFKSVVILMFENCKAYNEPNSILHQDACELQSFFDKVYQSQIPHRKKHNSDKGNDKDNDKENDRNQTEKNCIQNESEGIQLMPQKSVRKIQNPYTDGISSRESFQELQIPENEELSDYEKIRNKNIAEQKAMFLNNLKKSALNLSTSMTLTPKRPRPKLFAPRTEPNRKSSRSCVKENSYYEKTIYFEKVDSSFEGLPRKRRKSMPSLAARFDPNIDILQPEDITEEMLDNVATPSIGKIRHEDGTTCHQCRIKTMDNKTICRSGKCSGNRGMFCGTCLQNRYGQDARKALIDPNWWCPPCMNVCNCSICRTRIGKGATPKGSTQLAKERGFQSVHHYLKYKHALN